jgi:hypothetical protein
MKNKYIAIIALAILAVAVVSYAQLQKSSFSNANQANNLKINVIHNPYVEPDNSSSASTLAELQKDNIVSHPNWQTYLDPKFKYVIQYPKDWDISPTNNALTTGIPSIKDPHKRHLEIWGYINEKYEECVLNCFTGVSMYKKTFQNPDFSATETIIANQISFNKKDFTLSAQSADAEYVVIRGNDYFDIKAKLAMNSEDVKLFEEIISTFRFLNDAPTGIELWDTYNVKDLGFNLRYPPNYYNRIKYDDNVSLTDSTAPKILYIFAEQQDYIPFSQASIIVSFLGNIPSMYSKEINKYLAEFQNPSLVKNVIFGGQPAKKVELFQGEIQVYRLDNPPKSWAADHYILYYTDRGQSQDKETMDKVLQSIKIIN